MKLRSWEQENAFLYARVMELVDVPDSKSGGFGRAGSSPALGTIRRIRKIKNVERQATEPVRWPPINRGVGGGRQMRISCDLLNQWRRLYIGAEYRIIKESVPLSNGLEHERVKQLSAMP